MSKFQLGQRVRYIGYMHRDKGSGGAKWMRYSYPGEGIIVGKRTVSDGSTSWIDEGAIYEPTKYHSFWLVAHNLTGYRYVAEEDIIAVEVANGAGVDGYHWEKTGGKEDGDTEQ